MEVRFAVKPVWYGQTHLVHHTSQSFDALAAVLVHCRHEDAVEDLAVDTRPMFSPHDSAQVEVREAGMAEGTASALVAPGKDVRVHSRGESARGYACKDDWRTH